MAKKANGSGLPKVSSKPWGKDGKALDGVKILDFTHVQSGPTCTQLLAWFGADVIKVERPGTGDITRGQLQDVPGADSLYFTMLNHNKRSITLNSKSKEGMKVLERLVKTCDVLVENFAPGALDRMGLTWEHIHALNPRMVVASVKGFGPGPYEDCKVYENVAQCAGGSASTTGFHDGLPLVTGAQIGDSGTGLHLALGIVSALYQRKRTGRGQRVLAAMQDGVLNLCRVKLRDQQRLAHGPLKEYTQFGQDIPFGEATPRAGNDSGGGQPGVILKCKGWETDPNAYIYFITQAPVWEKICDLIGQPDWKTHPDYAKPPARLPRLKEIFERIEQWTMTKTKFEVMNECNAFDIPVGPILSMKELAEEPSLRADRHRRRGRSPDARQVPVGRQPDQALRQHHRGRALASPGRAYRRDPDQGAEVHAARDCRDQGVGRDGPGTAKPRPRSRSCASWFMASRPSARPCWRRCSSAARTWSASMSRRRSPARRPDPLKEAAVAAKLPVFQPASYRKPEVWEEFKALKPDLQVMAFVTLFVPEEFLNIPTHGSIQYHPSLLPAYRGASAINWPIILGEKETGLSIFWPDNGLDTGAVLLQKKTPIGPKDTLGTVYFDRLFPMGVEAMLESVDLVKAGKAPRLKQDEAKRHLRRPGHRRHRPHRLGQVVAADRSAGARLQSGARRLDDVRRQEPAGLRHPAAAGPRSQGHRRQVWRGRRGLGRRLHRRLPRRPHQGAAREAGRRPEGRRRRMGGGRQARRRRAARLSEDAQTPPHPEERP